MTYLKTTDYPKAIALRDESRLALRPLEPDDKLRLLRFFQRIPEEDRYYLKDNVVSPEVVHEWTAHINPERVTAIVAVAGDEIVGDATLHVSRAPARAHAGELRLVVDPEFRERGLGGRMIREMVDIAVQRGLDRVFFELVDRREKSAILAARGMGFSEAAVLPGRVRDMWGNLQDLMVLELPLGDRELWWRF